MAGTFSEGTAPAGHRWEDLTIGHRFTAIEYEVTPAAVRELLQVVGGDHPWYHGDSPYGYAIVPPALVMTDYTRLLAQVLPPITGMHARHQLRLIRPIPVGARVRLEGEILDLYIKRGHKYVVVVYRVVDTVGVPYMENTITTTIAGYIGDGCVEAA